jgi:hypothetical protein
MLTGRCSSSAVKRAMKSQDGQGLIDYYFSFLQAAPGCPGS